MTSSGDSQELHQVLPREQIGAATGDRYDFQYHEAAADALQVLDETAVACVYFEWHDDYVIETAGVLSYRFHQVQSRSSSQGPWTLNEFFGISRPRGRKPIKGPPKVGTATTDSIFGRLLDHVSKFGERCEWFVLVSDAGATLDLKALLDAAHGAEYEILADGPKAEFTRLHAALTTAFPTLTEVSLYDFLRRLYVRPSLGKLGESKDCRTLIGGRILNMSEVDLTISETQKIGSDLVALVREKSHRTLDPLPGTKAELRVLKGLVLNDVLRVLSLSRPGYRELQSMGRPAVVALSRMQRLFKRSGVDEDLIADFCRLKVNWDAWWVRQRHTVKDLDAIALKKQCGDAIRVHADGKSTFEDLSREAKSLAAKYAPVLTPTEPLTEDLVFGLMMAIAVETEQ